MVPEFLYGTAWKEADTRRCVADALAAGFRAIDTANQRKHYFEAGVGDALRDWFSTNPRASLFLQTKFTYQRGQDQRLPYNPEAPLPVQVEQSLHSSLSHLHTNYLDALLLHGPSVRVGWGTDDRAVWRALEGHQRAGIVRQIGVSNVRADQLRALLADAQIAPAFVQNRCYARAGWDAEVRAVCAENGIVYQGFSLLTANRKTWGHPTTAEIARRHGASPAQVIFRCAVALGILPITGTTDAAHMAQDLVSPALALDEAEIAAVVSVEAPAS